MSLLMQALKQAELSKGRGEAQPGLPVDPEAQPGQPAEADGPTLAPMETRDQSAARADEAGIIAPAIAATEARSATIPDLDALEGAWRNSDPAEAEPVAPPVPRAEVPEAEGWSRRFPPAAPPARPEPMPEEVAAPPPPAADGAPTPELRLEAPGDSAADAERRLREAARTRSLTGSALQHFLRNRRAVLIAAIGGLSLCLAGVFAYIYLQVSIDEARPAPPIARPPAPSPMPPADAIAAPEVAPGPATMRPSIGAPDKGAQAVTLAGSTRASSAPSSGAEPGVPPEAGPGAPARKSAPLPLPVHADTPALLARGMPRPALVTGPGPVVRPGAGSGREGIDIRAGATQALDPALGAAYQAYLAGDPGAAKAQYRRALLRDPNNRDALLGLAAIALAEQQGPQASALYGQLLELDPTDPDAIGGLSSLQHADPSQHESQLKKVLARHPQSGAVLFALGNLYAQQLRWPEAQQVYFRAFENAPGNADYAMNLAVSLDRLGQTRLALEYYRRALALAAKRAGNFSGSKVQERIRELDGADSPS